MHVNKRCSMHGITIDKAFTEENDEEEYKRKRIMLGILEMVWNGMKKKQVLVYNKM